MYETLEQAQAALREKNAAYQAELDKYGETDEIPSSAVKSLTDQEKEVGELEQIVADMVATSGAAKSLRNRAAERNERLGQATQTFGATVPANATEATNMVVASATKSLGTTFVKSQAFADYMRINGTKKGDMIQLPAEGRLPNSEPVAFNSSIKAMTNSVYAPLGGAAKALVTGLSDTSAGALVRPAYDANIDLPRRPLFFRDLVREMTVGTDTIEYVRFASRTNAAVPVAEATTTSNGTKPESALALEKVTDTVKTIANWMPVTRRALADAPQIRQMIDEELRANVEQTLEAQMVSGDGTGENFTGLETVSGVVTQAFATDIKTTIRKARTKAMKAPAYTLGGGAMRVNRGNVIVLMNPDDVEAYDLDTDAEERFYTGGPVQVYAPMIWGLPIVESEAVTAGFAWVFDASIFTLYDREETTIRVSDSHASFFIQNLVAILAEGRWGFGCKRPSAIIKADIAA